MKISTYFKEVYPKRKEISRNWNRYVSQYEDTGCPHCGEDRIIGEKRQGQCYIATDGNHIKEFSVGGQGIFYCFLCEETEEFDKEKLIFVKHYGLPIWIPYLLK